MGIVFERSVPTGPLKQGEIIRDLYEFRVQAPCSEPNNDDDLPIEAVEHPYLIVMSQDCDLAQDYRARYPDNIQFENPELEQKFRENPDRYLIDHIQVCVAQVEQDLRGNLPGGIFRSVNRNQVERYHHLGPGNIEESEEELDLFLDFKRSFSLLSASLYQAIYDSDKRCAVVPPIYLHDLSHRFHSYLSRVALPD